MSRWLEHRLVDFLIWARDVYLLMVAARKIRRLRREHGNIGDVQARMRRHNGKVWRVPGTERWTDHE